MLPNTDVAENTEGLAVQVHIDTLMSLVQV